MPSFTKENKIPPPEWNRIKTIRSAYKDAQRDFIAAKEVRDDLIRELSVRWGPQEIRRFLDTSIEVIERAIKDVPSMRG